jgi:Starch-binding associating with outer membrane
MKYIKIQVIVILLVSITIAGCKKYLDINNDPGSPQTPTLAALLPPVTAVMSRTMVLDGRFSGAYIQNFSNVGAGENNDIHGGNTPNGGGNQAWRDFYTVQGTAINLMIKQGIADEQWDYVGAAQALRAWGLQNATDIFSDMPYYEAWELNRVYFRYDNQRTLYKAVDSICRVALSYLDRSDGKVSKPVMARGDLVYAGDRAKWIRFVYGILARNWHHLSNKPDYNADSVISYVNKSMTSNADNFMITHSASKNDDTNPLGPARDNLSVRRQSKFMVQLLDGTTFYTNTLASSRDPRISRMLSASPDTSTITPNMPTLNGGYRFLTPSTGFTVTSSGVGFRQAPSTLWGDSVIINPSINNFTARVGKYLFQNNASFPIMTYFELQFIKAEAAFRKGDFVTALDAYKAGIGAHFDFVNTANTSANAVTQISAADKIGYLGSAAVKQTSGALTLTDIMLQKYIADFGWNFNESWTDVRRYHYFDLDPLTGQQVYKNMAITSFSSLNLGPKPAYRSRPTGFSENDWNLDELRRIGALNQDYHTYEMWFSQP